MQWIRSLGWEDPPGEGKGYLLQYSGLENSMDCVVHGVAKSRTRLSKWTELNWAFSLIFSHIVFDFLSWAAMNVSFIIFLNYYYYYFYFTILYWFCHTSTCICHGCTRVPHPEPLYHLPPPTIPLGHPRAPAPSFLYPASNLDWRVVSYMILYMF